MTDIQVTKAGSQVPQIGDKNWAFEELRDSGCTACRLHKETAEVCLVGQGPRSCGVMVVAEAPGERGGDVRDMLSGGSGQTLDLELGVNGLDRRKWYVTNAVKCRPPEGREPEPEEIEACLQHLLREIESIRPKYILSLGNTPLQALLHKKGITKFRGGIYDVAGAKMLATFHPSAVRQTPKLVPQFREDIKTFSELLAGKVHVMPTVTIVTKLEQVEELVTAVVASPAFSYDVETESLAEWSDKNKLYCIGIAPDPHHSWVIPWHHPEHSWTPFAQAEILKFLQWLFSADKKRVAHNGEFDNRWIAAALGVKSQHTFDTMLAAFLIDENLPVGLKPCARRYLGAGDYESAVDVTQLMPLDKLATYCGYDVCYTLQLYPIFRAKLLEDPAVARLFKLLLMPVTKVLSQVEHDGIAIDGQRLEERKAQAVKLRQERIDRLNSLLPESYAGKTINWNSTAALPKLLYGELQLPVLGYTEKGKPSTAEPVIKELRDKHPIINALLEYREIDKQLNTFLEPWSEWARFDGRLHSNYNLTRARTGRLSCDDPNFQQTPRDEFIRGIPCAEEGSTLIMFDLSQAELRLAAIKAQCRKLIQLFRDNQDPHLMTAVKILKVAESLITKETRKKAKAVNFGLIYGMGWKGLQRYAREKYDTYFTDEESQAYRNTYFEEYPELLVWHERQRILVRKFKQVRSWLGRIRHLPDIDSTDKKVRAEAERQAINSPIQATGSDICLLVAVIVDDLIEKAGARDVIRLVGLIHDSLLWEVKSDRVDRWLPTITRVLDDIPHYLETWFGFVPTVPIAYDLAVQKHWEEKE